MEGPILRGRPPFLAGCFQQGCGWSLPAGGAPAICNADEQSMRAEICNYLNSESQLKHPPWPYGPPEIPRSARSEEDKDEEPPPVVVRSASCATTCRLRLTPNPRSFRPTFRRRPGRRHDDTGRVIVVVVRLRLIIDGRHPRPRRRAARRRPHLLRRRP